LPRASIAAGRISIRRRPPPTSHTWRRRRTGSSTTAAQALGRAPVAEQRFQHALNGVVLRLTPAEADLIGRRDDVRLVSRERIHPARDLRQPDLHRRQHDLERQQRSRRDRQQGRRRRRGRARHRASTGRAIRSRPTGDDGYVTVNPLGSGVFKGTCNSSGDTGHCNNKLIGMYNFISALAGRSGADTDGHGSHTASTAAGGVVNNASFAGGTFALSGVAPHANIIAYLVCDASGCGDVAIQGAINQAVADTIVNVINYSIGGPPRVPWDDASALAFLGAQNAGIFVSASAGNSGPGASTTDNEEPWVATVAATTPGSIPSFDFDLTGPGSPPANTINLAIIPGSAPLPAQAYTNLPLIQSPTFSDGSDDGCDAFAANYFKRPQTAGGTGGIAVIRLDQNDSNCASGVRRTNALSCGRGGGDLRRSRVHQPRRDRLVLLDAVGRLDQHRQLHERDLHRHRRPPRSAFRFRRAPAPATASPASARVVRARTPRSSPTSPPPATRSSRR
jgi:hypothetical protein